MTVNEPGSPRTEPLVSQVARPAANGAAAWWIGALVAVVAILAVVFIVAQAPASSLDQPLSSTRINAPATVR